MALVSMRQFWDHAAEHGYGLPAFNVNSMEQIKAIMDAAAATRSPVILQAPPAPALCRRGVPAPSGGGRGRDLSRHPDRDAPGPRRLASVCASTPSARVLSSVMMDGSLKEDGKTPADHDYNIAVTRKVSNWPMRSASPSKGSSAASARSKPGPATRRTATAEGKLDREQLLTDPDEAAEFVQATQCDALAIAIGTSHGAYKFTRRPTGDILAIDRIKEIHARVPKTTSSCTARRRCRRTPRGDPRPWRRDPRDLRRAGRGDPGRHPLRRAQGEHRHRYPPRHDGRDPPRRRPRQIRIRSAQVHAGRHGRSEARLHLALRVVRRGREADRIRPIGLDRMASRYASGELSQVVH